MGLISGAAGSRRLGMSRPGMNPQRTHNVIRAVTS